MVGIFDGRYPVGNEYGAFARHGHAEIAEDFFFGFGIDRRQAIVENQYSGPFDERPGNGHALLLATRKGDAPFADGRFEAVFERDDVMVYRGLPSGSLHCSGIGRVEAERNIVADGVGKKEYVVRNKADFVAVSV